MKDLSTNIEFKDDKDYSKDEIRVKNEYINSVDERLKEAYIKVVNGDDKYHRYNICKVNKRQRKDLEELFSWKFDGYKNSINTSCLQHINVRHGKNGTSDHTMSNPNDVARIKYVLENYDELIVLRNNDGDILRTNSFIDKNQESAFVVLYKKSVNGIVYVAQAIIDSKYKKLWVLSTYATKKEVTQTSND